MILLAALTGTEPVLSAYRDLYFSFPEDLLTYRLRRGFLGPRRDLFIEGIDEGIFLPGEGPDALANKAGFHCGEDPEVWFPWFIDQVIEARRHEIEIELKADGQGPHEVQ